MCSNDSPNGLDVIQNVVASLVGIQFLSAATLLARSKGPASSLIFWITRSLGPAGRNGTSTSSLASNVPAAPLACATTRSFAPPTASTALAWNTTVSENPLAILIVPLSFPEKLIGDA